MAKKVFEYIWKDQKDAVCWLAKCWRIAIGRSVVTNTVSKAFWKRSAMLQKKQAGLREMCALGDISREVFLKDNQKIETELVTLKKQLDDLDKLNARKMSRRLI